MNSRNFSTNRQPLILLTNDDGIDSPGLMATVAAVKELGELLVVAPATQQTGMGRSTPVMTDETIVQKPLSVDGHAITAYAIPGSPAQAVLYGILVLAKRTPDLVISGINYGENIGSPVTASGTVGAALEAAVAGIPALAVSLETDRAYHYEHGTDVSWGTAIHFTRYFAETLLAWHMPADVDVLNVNIPANAAPGTPWRLTSQSRQPYWEIFRSKDSANGQRVHLDYRMNICWDTLEPDSDIQAFAADHVVTVTPLSINVTSRTDFAQLERMLT